jgi:hypothetical protein
LIIGAILVVVFIGLNSLKIINLETGICTTKTELDQYKAQYKAGQIDVNTMMTCTQNCYKTGCQQTNALMAAQDRDPWTYDINNNCLIDLNEVTNSINDWSADIITLATTVNVQGLWSTDAIKPNCGTPTTNPTTTTKATTTTNAPTTTVIVCSNNAQCGGTVAIGSAFCYQNNLVQDRTIHQCLNPGLPTSSCTAYNDRLIVQTCTNGCSTNACATTTTTTTLPQPPTPTDWIYQFQSWINNALKGLCALFGMVC